MLSFRYTLAAHFGSHFIAHYLLSYDTHLVDPILDIQVVDSRAHQHFFLLNIMRISLPLNSNLMKLPSCSSYETARLFQNFQILILTLITQNPFIKLKSFLLETYPKSSYQVYLESPTSNSFWIFIYSPIFTTCLIEHKICTALTSIKISPITSYLFSIIYGHLLDSSYFNLVKKDLLFHEWFEQTELLFLP